MSRPNFQRKYLSALTALAMLCACVAHSVQRVHAAGSQTTTLLPEPTMSPPNALAHERDPLRGPSWGPGGPWAAQQPYAPRPKPPDWIDPEPSRWPWTGQRDPYDDEGRIPLHRCAGAHVDVAAESSDERRLVCSAAGEAIQLLGRCGIPLRRPLNVQIKDEVRHPFNGAIFGLFDPQQERILITHETNIPSLVAETPYAKLRQRDFYRSLIVHEVIHGVMYQNLKRPPASHAAYEYAAYALQIESLAPDVRDEFLQSFDQDAVQADDILFNDPVLFFDPYLFAARAYHHLKASTDGCAHLSALLKDEAAFIAPPRM